MEIAELEDNFFNFGKSALINLESSSALCILCDNMSFHNQSFVSESKNAIIQLPMQLLGVSSVLFVPHLSFDKFKYEERYEYFILNIYVSTYLFFYWIKFI